MGIDYDRPLGNDGTGEFGRCRPPADADAENQHDQDAGQHVPADRLARGIEC